MGVTVRKNLLMLLLVAFMTPILTLGIQVTGGEQHVYAANESNGNGSLQIDPFKLKDGNASTEFSNLFNKILNWIIGITLALAVVSGGLLAAFLNFAIGQRQRETAKTWGFGIIGGLVVISTIVTIVKVIYNALTT